MLPRIRAFGTVPISLSKYIAEVKPSLKPPVSNRMIYNEQLQLMVVGGPNQRKVQKGVKYLIFSRIITSMKERLPNIYLPANIARKYSFS